MTGSALWRTWTGVVLISFSGVWVRLADVEAVRSAFLRNAYALPVLLALAWWMRRAGRSGPLVMPVAVGAGVLLGIDLIAYHAGIGIIGAGLGTLMPNLQVVVVGILALVVFDERPHPGFWFALPVVLAGVWLVGATGVAIELDGSVLLGIAFGVVSAVFYGGFIAVLRLARLRRPGADAYQTVASATLGAAIGTGIAAVWQGVAAPAGSWPADGWLVVLALGSQVAGWLLLTSSIHRLPVALTSVALLLQPVLAMVWGATLLDEPLGWPQAGGAAVLLVGVAAAHRAVVAGQRRRSATVEDETLT